MIREIPEILWYDVIVGAAVFGEAVDPFVVSGGLIIIASVFFITWREAVLKRRGITPAGPETKG